MSDDVVAAFLPHSWGILLVTVAYWMVWVKNPFWLRQPATWKVAVSICFFTAGSVLVWSAVRTLGRQWRIDAGLNSDHELVRTGPYALVRHPIYLSMFCMFLATGFLVASTRVLLLAGIVFLIGTEIRMRIEDGLLKARFGAEFEAYRRGVRGYLPLVR